MQFQPLTKQNQFHLFVQNLDSPTVMNLVYLFHSAAECEGPSTSAVSCFKGDSGKCRDTLSSLEGKVENCSSKLDKLDGHMEKVEERLEKSEARTQVCFAFQDFILVILPLQLGVSART